MTRPIRTFPSRMCLVSACVLTPLFADGPSDLHNALARLKSKEPVKVSADYQFWRDTGSERHPKIVQGRIQVMVEEGPSGLRFTWPVQVLNQARQESQATLKNPESPAPVTAAMRELDVLKVQTSLDASEELLQELEQARFVEEHPAVWRDRATRQLSFKLEPRFPEEERKALKHLEATLTLWITPEGLPLASATSVAFKASRMLISLEGTQKEERVFQLQNGRLVVTNRTQEESTSAMGDRTRTRTILSLTLP